MQSQKLVRLKSGIIAAQTSALMLPKVVSVLLGPEVEENPSTGLNGL
jgi:hypothetical protein